MSTIRSILLAACAAVCSAGYGQTAASPPKATATKIAPGANAGQDQHIEAVIRAKLAKSKIGADGFTIRVQGGVAIWEGTTTVPQHKGAATRMARTAGATAVVNNIKVSGAGVPSGESPRRAQIKHE